jgi:hypothetical protein
MNVSFQVARMWQTAKKSPEIFCGPINATFLASYCSYVSSFFFPFPPLVFSTGFSSPPCFFSFFYVSPYSVFGPFSPLAPF